MAWEEENRCGDVLDMEALGLAGRVVLVVAAAVVDGVVRVGMREGRCGCCSAVCVSWWKGLLVEGI